MKVKSSVPNKNVVKALQLLEQGDRPQAGQILRKVLQATPTDWRALFCLSQMLYADGKWADALPYLKRLVLVHPTLAVGWELLCSVHENLGHYDDALEAIKKCVAVEPRGANGWNRYGALLLKMNQELEALRCFDEALSIHPNDEMVLANVGKILFSRREYAKAGAIFQRLLTLNPDYRYAKGLLAFNKAHEAQWDGLEDAVADIIADIRKGKPSCMPLAFMSMTDSAEDALRCARQFCAHFFPPAPVPAWQGQAYRHDKVVLAYVSADYREHPVGHLMAGVIENHDRSRFEVIGISLGLNDQSPLRLRFERIFDRFIEAHGMSTADIVRRVLDLEVDILVDLGGFTQGSRIDLMARRVAPVQVNYLGYPGTMGAPYVDYILADPYVIPESAVGCYSEQVAYLPHTYLPTDRTVAIAQRTPTRSDMGLPEQGFVFCSFNHIYKINPPIFTAWMGLLQSVAHSVLWLSAANEDIMNRLRCAAQDRGVDPARLVFAQRVPAIADHLARYRVADLFLDTVPYNAHTTAADALYAGLPVLTCMGNTFSSRVAGSLLHAIGLPELVTHSLDQYCALALDLATHPDKITAIKSKLQAHQTSFPLFNTPQFTRYVEAAWVQMHQRQQAGLPPASFRVPA